MHPNDRIAASIATLEEENRRLDRTLDELAFPDGLARAIGASLSSREIKNTAVRRSMRAALSMMTPRLHGDGAPQEMRHLPMGAVF